MGVKIVNAGICDGKDNPTAQERSNHGIRGIRGKREPDKVRFRGTVQNNAVPCGFGECRVESADCRMLFGSRPLSECRTCIESEAPMTYRRRKTKKSGTYEGNVDSGGFLNFDF